MGKPGSWKALPTFKPHSSPHFSPKIAFNGQTTCNLGFRYKKKDRFLLKFWLAFEVVHTHYAKVQKYEQGKIDL